MIWERILGHDVQIEMFRRAIQRGRLAHGYLLIGPQGIGKRLFAQLLAQCLFCERIPDQELDACGECASCRQMLAGTHPDWITVGLPEGKREIPIELMVGDRENRGRVGLCHEIAMAPMKANRRIALIDDAEAMNEASANSLLKTLEEPPPGSMLILLTPDEEPILPTIRSRCQPVRFARLSDEQLLRLLSEQGHDVSSLEEVIPSAQGSLEVARQLLDPGLQQLWQTIRKHLQARRLETAVAVKDVSEALDAIGSDTSTQRQSMRWAVGFAVESLRQQLAEAASDDERDRLGEMLDRCFEADLHLRQTMPVPLCLESLFSELARRSRM